MGDAAAIERGADLPRNSYAVLDSALRCARGETLDGSRDRSASLWAGYAAVAIDNPHAADRRGMDAAQIREPSDDNRFVSWPYTKAMCANNNVDHGGAIVIASTEAADSFSVSVDKRVYPRQCVLGSDTDSLISRYGASTAPGLAAAGAALKTMVGDLDEIEHLDLYSCFPSMVALTAELLQISTDRALTVTGRAGLCRRLRSTSPQVKASSAWSIGCATTPVQWAWCRATAVTHPNTHSPPTRRRHLANHTKPSSLSTMRLSGNPPTRTQAAWRHSTE